MSRNHDIAREMGRIDASTAGWTASAAWLDDRGVAPVTRWSVTIELGVLDTRFRIEIYAEEWGYFFSHHGRASWIRITDVPFAHGRDDFGLLARTPALAEIGALLRALEQEHGVELDREHALVRTTLPSAEPAIRRWIRWL